MAYGKTICAQREHNAGNWINVLQTCNTADKPFVSTSSSSSLTFLVISH